MIIEEKKPLVKAFSYYVKLSFGGVFVLLESRKVKNCIGGW